VGTPRADPCVRHRYRHDRLSVCSGVAVSPQRRRVALYLRCRPRNLSGLDIRAFLQHLLRHLRGPIDVLWDRGPIHRRREVRAFLAHHPRLAVHYFPAYAPELNPAEYVWAHADHELANGRARRSPPAASAPRQRDSPPASLAASLVVVHLRIGPTVDEMSHSILYAGLNKAVWWAVWRR